MSRTTAPSTAATGLRSGALFSKPVFWWILLLTAFPAAPPAGAELGSAQLQIAGTRLVIDNPSQTVPFDTPTLIGNTLVGYDPERGVLPADLRVLGDFSGPEVDGVLTLETVPNEPFRIPRLRLKGEYLLSDVRLVQGETVLAYAEPREATVNVQQVLLTSVSSRALTWEEIQALGLPIDEDSYSAMSLSFAFGIGSQEVRYTLPLIRELYGPDVDWAPAEEQVKLPMYEQRNGTVRQPRWTPPRMIPFAVNLTNPPAPEVRVGGCDPRSECRPQLPPEFPMVGVILFPTDVSLLHQYFSVVLMVQNGAPEGDVLTVKDLVAKAVLPSGLRLHETEPPTVIGTPVPVRDPGPDGEIGTGDDVNVIIAHAMGSAELFVEGRREGTHLVDFEMSGMLEGLPTGPQRIAGHAKGAVVVRDPNLSVRVAHPQVVRADIEYPMYMTVTNLGNAPVNQISLSLPPSGLAGVELAAGEVESQQIAALNPGDSATVEWRMLPLLTGKVVSTSMRAPSTLDPSIEYSVSVGGAGSLSPDTLVLPTDVDNLPQELLRPALGLIGLGYSLAEAPRSLDSGLPRLGIADVKERIYRLSEAGRHYDFGESLFDVTALMASEWNGAREQEWGWDELRRTVKKGGQLAAAVADVLSQESSSSLAAFEQLAATTHFLGQQAAVAIGPGATLEVASRTSGKTVSGAGEDESRVRDLAFAELYDLNAGTADAAEMVLLSDVEDGGFEARLRSTSGSADLHLLVPDAAGDLRVARWTGVALTTAGVARVSFQRDDLAFTLEVDSDGDGVAESQLAPAMGTVAKRPFQVIAAVQNSDDDPSSHLVDVVFSEDVELTSLCADPASGVCQSVPAKFVLPDNPSNGGLVPEEANLVGGILSGYNEVENPFAGLSNPRIVRVSFENPISPLVASPTLTVSGLKSVYGQDLGTEAVPLTVTADALGILVRGKVFGPDGLPVPDTQVVLYERDLMTVPEVWCQRHPTSRVRTDANGEFLFDYVRQTECSDVFTLKAQDPGTGSFGEATGRVRVVGQELQLNILMPQRGGLEGQVRYDDGSIPERVRVVASNPERGQGRLAHVTAGGRYDVAGMIVGTITLAVDDYEGSFAYKTVELPSGGVTVEEDLVLLRRREQETPPPGRVRGRVTTFADGAPVFDAFVALYVEETLTAVRRSDRDGRFDFGQVPAGIAEIEVFSDGYTARGVGEIYHFEIYPDRLEDVEVKLRDDVSTLEGYVYDRHWDGTASPAAGAVVWLEGTPFHTQTDAAGFYRLEDLFLGDWRVRVLTAEERTAAAGVTVVSGGAVVNRDVYVDEPLPQGGIVGRVLSYDGVTPVAGAAVHLSGGHLSTRWHHEAQSDANGYFKFEDLGTGAARVGVHAVQGQDGGLAWADIRFPGDTAYVTVVFKKGKIRVETYESVAGVEVPVASQIAYRRTQVSWSMAVLEADWNYEETDPTYGVLEIDALAGPYEFQAWNAFHDSVQAGRGELVYNGEVVTHRIVFEPNGAIRGTVYDVDGETPVAGVEVSLQGGSFENYVVHTDEEGRFEFLSVPRGSYHIYSLHQEGAVFRQESTMAIVRQHGEELDVEIVLPEQGSIVGWVETSQEPPVAVPGAVVTLREHGYPHRRIVVNADDEGNYSFHNIFSGKVTISAQSLELGGLGSVALFEVTGEGEEVTAVVSLQEFGEIAGHVVNPQDGAAVPNAEVRLASGPSLEDTTDTDDAGNYRFRLLPVGWYEVRVWDPASGRKGLAWALVEAQDHVAPGDVSLETRGVVQGSFVDGETGLPVPGAVVRLGHRFVVYATTDYDGNYEFQGIPAGDVLLSARSSDGRRFVQATATLSTEDEVVVVDLQLEPTTTVTGTVLNPPGLPDGPFVPSTNVWVVQGGDVIGAGFDNPFTFDGLINKQIFRVYARENGNFRQGSRQGLVSEAGVPITLDVRMQAVGSLDVAVEDSFGNPVNGADVVVSNQHDYGRAVFQASSGADNLLSTSDVREGNVWVQAKDPLTGLAGSEAGELTSEGQNLVLTVVLEDSGAVRGRAVRADGATSAAYARVSLYAGGKWYLTEADEVGAFEFADIRMGGYKLVVQEKDGLGLVEKLGTLATNGQVDDYGVLVLDEVPPRVVGIDPQEGSRNLPPGTTTVTVTFSEPIDTTRLGSQSIRLRERSSSGVAVTKQWSADQTSVTLVPTNGLKSGTLYDVFVDSDVAGSYGVFDTAGRALAFKVRSSFYTADVIPPAVIDTLPRNGDTQVPLDTLMTVTFSEPVDLASLSGTAVQMTDETVGLGVTTTVQLRPGEREILVTPQITAGVSCGTDPFCPDRDIRLTVRNVADEAGNVMPAPVSVVFWTPDETLPDMTWLTPGAGEVFTAGDDVAILVDATDNRGVAQADFSIASAVSGTWSTTVAGNGTSQETLSWTIPAPIVSASTSVTITATVTDIFGNSKTWTRDVTVEPRSNAAAPSVLSACPVSGDLVAPGLEIPIPFSMADDEAIESLWLEVDGTVVEHRTPYNQPSAEDSFLWTPPAGSAPGTSFDVRVKARDFAGNTTEHAVVLAVPVGTLLTGDATVDSTYDAQALFLAAGTFTLTEALAPQSLSLLYGATLDNAAPVMDFQVTGTMHVQCGALVDATGTGFAAGSLEPAGLQGPENDSGACHGGVGEAMDTSVPCEVYDSVYLPTMPGGGAPSGTGDGGGLMVVTAAELAVDGELRSRGVTGWGSGAGGTITVDVGTLRGQGLVNVTGGTAGWSNTPYGGNEPHGRGGGGRVALYADQVIGFDVRTQAVAFGGNLGAPYDGGPGTVFTFVRGTSTYGHLHVAGDESTQPLPVTPLPGLGAGAVTATEVVGTDLRITAATAFRERWRGAWVELEGAPGQNLGRFPVLDVGTDGRILVGNAGTLSPTAYAGLYLFDEISFGPGAAFTASDPVEAGTLTFEADTAVAGTLTADVVHVKDGATVRPSAGGSLVLNVDTLIVDAGGVVEVNGEGYLGGEGPAGVVLSQGAGGGSHGGVGESVGTGVAGEVFGSVYEPRLAGGGAGGAGGGSIVVNARVVQLDGELQARGAEALTGGASGAGGSVLIVAEQLSGNGGIDVVGGPHKRIYVGAWYDYGGGGGGRVGLRVDDLGTFDPVTQVVASGGDAKAGLGTVYVRTLASQYGSLYLDGDGVDPVPAATLPALGSGSLSLTEADGVDAGDLWVTRQGAAFPERWRGAWIALRDGVGGDLGTFEVTDVDAGGRLRLEGAAAASGAVSYTGEYRFDEVVVESGVDFEPTDPVNGAALVFTGATTVEGDLVADEVVLKTGAVVTPATSGALRLVVGKLTVEAGATLDATGLGYAGGGSNAPGVAPSWVAPSESWAGGSHGGVGAGTTPGDTYDSVYAPTLAGGGGAGSFSVPSGKGGGTIWIEATEVDLRGTIRSRGAAGKGGGAGGSVHVEAQTLYGSGLIDVRGDGACGNGGGGGRIALDVGDLSGFDVATQALAHGGGDDGCVPGGPGTVYFRTATSVYGDLRVDNGLQGDGSVRSGRPAFLPPLGGGTVLATEEVAAGTWVTGDVPFHPVWRGVRVTLFDAAGTSLGEYEVADLDGTSRILLQGAFAVSAASSFEGRYLFDNLRLVAGADFDAVDSVVVTGLLEAAGDDVELPPALAAGDLTLKTGATVRPATGGELHLTAVGTLTLEAGAVLDVSHLGYPALYGGNSGPGTAPEWVTPAPGLTGGSHGGFGNSGTPPGDVYDSVYQPALGGGSGGGHFYGAGGDGGGVVELRAASVVLEGSVLALGENVKNGGAGGTVAVFADTLSGGGSIDASGQGTCSNSGGGGRVSLQVDDLGTFDPATQVRARGGGPDGCSGSSFGTPGTVFVKTQASTWGDLRVDNGTQGDGSPRPSAATALPSLGLGTVVASEDSAGDAWLQGDFTFRPVWLGAWLAFVDDTGATLGTFEVREVGTDGRALLAGAAGAAAPGLRFRGLYRFDTGHVAGGAGLDVPDWSEVSSWNLDAGSSVDLADQSPPVVGTITPADGAVFAGGAAFTVTADVTDDVAVATVTLHFDGQDLVDDTAPYSWDLVAPAVGATTSYPLSVEAVDTSGVWASVSQTIQVTPATPPAVSFACPSSGALVAPSLGLDVTVDASHEDGIDRVEVYLDGVFQATLTTAPYVHTLAVPGTAVAGEVLELRAVAYNTGQASAEATTFLRGVEGQAVTVDTLLVAGDLSLDGGTVLVAAGATLTVDGPHSFVDLVVQSGATLTHSPTTAGVTNLLDVDLTGDLYVACGGAIDVAGRGYPAGVGHPNDPSTGAADGIGGSHGGRGGLFDTATAVTGGVYGDLFDPRDPGAGGGGAGASAGGGVIDLLALGGVLVDGAITARGGQDGADVVHGAGGSVRIDGSTLAGLGTIDASGAGGSGGAAGGGGGRIALFGASIDAGLLDRATVHGGQGPTPQATGAAGTLFVRRDTDTYGELFVENVDAGGADVVSTQVTELPPMGDVSFDRVVVAGQATVVATDAVTVTVPAEVAAGSGWLPGYAPSVAITGPADGTVLVAGQSFTVTADVTDLLGLLDVAVSFDGSSASDLVAPHSWQLSATYPTVDTQYPVTVTVTDFSGNVLTDTVTVTVTALAGSGPTVIFGDCPADQEWVTPGQTLTVPFTASDEDVVTGWTFKVNGVEQDSATTAATDVAASVTWTVPVDAQPGEVFTLVADAQDQTGAHGFAQIQLQVPASWLVGPLTLDAATYGGQSLLLGPGTFTVSEPLTLSSLTLLGGATLVGTPQATLDLTVTGTLAVQCGGALDVSGLGYRGAYSDGATAAEAPAGMTAAGKTAGACHGGTGLQGWVNGETPCEVYGSVYRPQLGGGGGGTYYSSIPGGNGGGALVLTVGQLVLDGRILAHGQDRYHATTKWAGGGAGGSILVEATTISGTGSIEAEGGTYDRANKNNQGGAGGGGRVAIYATDLTGFDPAAQISVRGGDHLDSGGTSIGFAATGTVFVFQNGVSSYGRLIVDDGASRNPVPTVLPALGTDAVAALETAGADAWVTPATITLYPRWVGAFLVLADGSGAESGAYRVLEVDTAGNRARLEGAAGVSGVAFHGEYRFDQLDLISGAGVTGADPVYVVTVDVEGDLALPPYTKAGSVTVRSGGRLLPAAGGSLTLRVAGALAVEPGGLIDVSGLGYRGTSTGVTAGAPAGVTPAGRTAGGCHGGSGLRGWETGDPLCEVYDSVYQPTLGGGGGGTWYTTRPGGDGGGSVVLTAAQLILDGQILANGESRLHSVTAEQWAGGGAGGSILIDAETVTGTGSIEAVGGTYDGASTSHGGAAGGGRVAFYATWLTGFDPQTQVSVRGGRQIDGSGTVVKYGASGTTYVFQEGVSVYGRLIVTGDAALAVETSLPELGSDTVLLPLTDDANGLDAWLVPTTLTLLPRWRGAFMVLVDGSGNEMAAYRVLDVDAGLNRALLEGAAGLSGVAGFHGEYRFDDMVSPGAGVIGADPIYVEALDVQVDFPLPTSIRVGNMTVRSGGRVFPAAGGSLTLDVVGTLDVMAGGSIDVSGLGYRGTAVGVTAEAPAGVTPAGRTAGGCHGGVGLPGWVNDPPCEVYGSVDQPMLGGGGGGTWDVNYPGGQGGGTVVVTADQLILDGQILANGEDRFHDAARNWAGGGAGGSVLVDATTVTGTGSIEAEGGTYDGANVGDQGGAAGGGRVALYATSLAGFDPAAQISVRGGDQIDAGGTAVGYAATGTLFVFQDAVSGYGRLIVDNGDAGRDAAATFLPSLGSGTAQAGSGGADLVTGLASVPSYFAGHWVEVSDAAGTVKGSWPIASVLGGTVTLAPVLGETVAIAQDDLWRGVYRFDEVELRNNADLMFDDRVEVSVWDLDGTSTVALGDLVPPVFGTVAPADGAAFAAGAPLTVTAAVTDDVAVEWTAVSFDAQVLYDDAEPYEWSLTAPLTPGSYLLVLEALDTSGNRQTLVRTITVNP